MNDIAIDIKHIEKCFKVYNDKSQSIKEKVLFRKRNRYEKRTVLRDISLTVRKGEAVGLIGHNGCGKSTLLKMMTRIMYPDKGSLEVNGRVSSLIELGAGFHPDMSGRENIYINASIFGLSKHEIEKRINDIIEFSELEQFMDNPVRTYSSGMYMRLAFAVAINVDADVLLIDEILGVGDTNFQLKCFEKIKSLKQSGVTIVVVSHSLEQLEQFCDRSYWIDDGLIVDEGQPKLVHEHYLSEMEKIRVSEMEKAFQKKNAERVKAEGEPQEDPAEEPAAEPESPPAEQTEQPAQPRTLANKPLPLFCDETAIRMGNGDVEFTDAVITDEAGNAKYVFQTGETIYVHINYKSVKPGILGNFGYGVFRDDGVHAYGTNIQLEYNRFEEVKDSGSFVITVENRLLPGKYFFDIAVHTPDGVFMDDIRRVKSFAVSSDKHDVGVCRLPSKWAFK